EDIFKSNAHWKKAGTIGLSRDGKLLNISGGSGSNLYIVSAAKEGDGDLVSHVFFADSHISFEYILPKDAEAKVFLQGRYAVDLATISKQKVVTHQDEDGLDARADAQDAHGVAPSVDAVKSAGEW